MLRGRLKDFIRILGSGLAVNVSTFVVLALAPIALGTESFATLTLVVAGTLFGVTLLDAGLYTTTIRQFAATKDARIIGGALRIRFSMLAVSATVALLAFSTHDLVAFSIAALCAGFLNVWNGLRSIDLAREDHAAFARANFAMSAARLAFGPLALLTGSWLWVSIALFVVPVLVVGAVRARGLVRDLAVGRLRVLGALLGYSTPVYLSALAYGACTYLPQAIAAARLDDIAVGSLGVALMLATPLILANAALRAMLLPRISAGGRLSDELGLRPGGKLILAAVAIVLVLSGVVIGSQLVYGFRFPDIGLISGAILMGYVAAIPFALASMTVHRIGRPGIEAIVNMARLLVTGPLLWFAASSAVVLAATAALLLLLGEIALFLVVRRAAFPIRRQCR